MCSHYPLNGNAQSLTLCVNWKRWKQELGNVSTVPVFIQCESQPCREAEKQVARTGLCDLPQGLYSFIHQKAQMLRFMDIPGGSHRLKEK